jgi:hypothetical protein
VAWARMVAAASTSQVSRPLWIDAGPIPAAARRAAKCGRPEDAGAPTVTTGTSQDATRTHGDAPAGDHGPALRAHSP